MIWRTKEHAQRGEIDLSSEAVVMGILNVTPDSFSDGGKNFTYYSAVEKAREMVIQGARIIDIGGESTRPGATPVQAEEEISRVVPVIECLRKLKEFDSIYISVDTSKAIVAEKALQAGADIVNDVTGCTIDPKMIPLLAKTGAGVVVMHMQGTPKNMQENPTYENVISEVYSFFTERLNTLTSAGVLADLRSDIRVPRNLKSRPCVNWAKCGFTSANNKACSLVLADSICLDPGIGFGKTDQHNLSLLVHIEKLAVADRPVLLGISRKSIFGRLLGEEDPQERDAATISMTTLARNNGCMLHRVHDVKGNFDALRMTEHYLNT